MSTTQPTKLTDSAFKEFVDRLYKETLSHLAKWNVDKGWFEGEFSTDVEEWNVGYADDENPLTKNRLSTMRKNTARHRLEPQLHKLIDFLRGNVKVTESDQRKMSIYIEPHDRHATPATTISPDIHVELNHIRRVTGFFTQEGTDDRGKPDGVSSIQMAHGIIEDVVPAVQSHVLIGDGGLAVNQTPHGLIEAATDTETNTDKSVADGSEANTNNTIADTDNAASPVTVKRLMHENLDLYSRSSFMLEFDDADRGKRVYMAARYVMRASSSGYGPWSEICFAIIP